MHALSVRQLVKVYANGVQALAGIDLDVPRGDFCALLGPNGAGKTSLIGIVTSLVRKTSGEVSVFGHDLDRELNAVKSAIGVVPQEINLNLWDKVSNIVVNQAGFYGVPPARAWIVAGSSQPCRSVRSDAARSVSTVASTTVRRRSITPLNAEKPISAIIPMRESEMVSSSSVSPRRLPWLIAHSGRRGVDRAPRSRRIRPWASAR